MRKFFLALLVSCSLSSCLYSNIRVPLDVDLWETRLGNKVGTSSNHSVLWLIAWGDAGVKAAAEQGGLTKINHMDMAVQTYFFGLYTRRDTIVYGE